MNLKTFNHVKIPELNFELNAVTTEGGRRYTTPQGNIYPSITTVLSEYSKKGIMEWRAKVGNEEANRISTKAARRGTALHTVCEKYLLNQIDFQYSQSLMPDTKELFLQLKPHIDDNVGDVYAIEQSLYSDSLQVAGRNDCIAEWNGKISVIDYKSASKEKNENWIQNYFMQCTAYAIMFEEITGREIEQIVVAIAVADGQSQIFVRNKTKYIQPLTEFVGKYHGKLLTL